jgi:hypothetical protein
MIDLILVGNGACLKDVNKGETWSHCFWVDFSYLRHTEQDRLIFIKKNKKDRPISSQIQSRENKQKGNNYTKWIFQSILIKLWAEVGNFTSHH